MFLQVVWGEGVYIPAVLHQVPSTTKCKYEPVLHPWKTFGQSCTLEILFVSTIVLKYLCPALVLYSSIQEDSFNPQTVATYIYIWSIGQQISKRGQKFSLIGHRRWKKVTILTTPMLIQNLLFLQISNLHFGSVLVWPDGEFSAVQWNIYCPGPFKRGRESLALALQWSNWQTFLWHTGGGTTVTLGWSRSNTASWGENRGW